MGKIRILPGALPTWESCKPPRVLASMLARTRDSERSGDAAASQTREVLTPPPAGAAPSAHSADSPVGAKRHERLWKDEPAAYNLTRGCKQLALAAAESPKSRSAAVEAYRKDVRAASDTSTSDARTWEGLHKEWWQWQGSPDLPAYPLTVEKIEAVGAMLKVGGYRSTSNYMSRAKDTHIGLKHPWTDDLAREAHRFSASTQRGKGPPRQSEPLDFVSLMGLDLPDTPLVPSGPLGSGNLATLVTHFVLREIEGSLARSTAASINEDKQLICWRLPSSKTDPQALGCVRSWGCLCQTAPAGARACPYHAGLRQRDLIIRTFGQLSDDLPFFPTNEGKAVAPEVMVALVEYLAEQTGEAIISPSGHRKFGKHSWRSTGAVYLSSLGLELFKLQLLARWSSAIVLHYARTAPLAELTTSVARLQSHRSLDDVLSTMRSSIDSLTTQIGTLDVCTAQHINEESSLKRRLEALESRHDESRPASFREYVVNEQSSKFHRILYDDPLSPPALWRACCGWSYGLSMFRRSEILPGDYKLICDKCMPSQRRERQTSLAPQVTHDQTA